MSQTPEVAQASIIVKEIVIRTDGSGHNTTLQVNGEDVPIASLRLTLDRGPYRGRGSIDLEYVVRDPSPVPGEIQQTQTFRMFGFDGTSATPTDPQRP